MAPVPQFTCQEENDEQYGEDGSLKRGVACDEDGIKPLLQVAHITQYHYAEYMLEILFVIRTERLAWLW